MKNARIQRIAKHAELTFCEVFSPCAFLILARYFMIYPECYIEKYTLSMYSYIYIAFIMSNYRIEHGT